MTERVTYVELDLNRCSLRYGVSPCTAAIGTTGDKKCFNTLATCQDRANYDAETVTVRYSTVSGDARTDIEAIPSVQSIDVRPSKLELGESIGIRASVTIQFKDHRFPDTGPDGDYYLADREYDPYKRGTYWGKFRARQPFTRGQNIRIIRGTSDQSLAQMETRHFIVDSVAGPTSSGQFTIVAKDALKLADGDRAQAPKLSNGYLAADITDTATSFTLEPVGIGDIDYPASGKAQIGGKEIVTFTRSGDTVTLTGRGQNGTEAQEHDAEDRFQICLTYTGAKATAIISDLLTTYADVPASYIPTATWTTEDDTYIARLYTAVIAEPTAVSKLINEVLVQTASTVWWDDEIRLLRFRVLRAISSTAATYNDDLIVGGSFQAIDQPDRRVSQVWTYFGQINPLEDLDDPKNYRSTLATTDLPSEDNFGGVPAIRQIFSRWIPSAGRDAASRLNNLLLSRYATPPRMFSFNLQRDRGLTRPTLGGGYRLESWTLQDDTGSENPASIQTIQVRNTDTAHNVMAEEVLFSDTVAPDDPQVRNFPIQDNENNVNLREIYDNIYAPPDSETTITVTIEEGVIIGSSSTSSYALDTGLWPEGPTLKIVNLGRIQGKGGAGGAGGTVDSGNDFDAGPPGGNGENGGSAILVTYDFELDNADGEIWSGGGGGGGGGGARYNIAADIVIFTNANGSGGGGGQGRIESNGGIRGGDESQVFSGYKMGNAGGGGTSSNNGGGGGSVFVSGSDDGLTVTATAGAGGNGGGAGLAGGNGGAGDVTSSDGDTIGDIAAGGTGGQPGNAIVQSGATVTITATGDIRGAIV